MFNHFIYVVMSGCMFYILKPVYLYALSHLPTKPRVFVEATEPGVYSVKVVHKGESSYVKNRQHGGMGLYKFEGNATLHNTYIEAYETAQKYLKAIQEQKRIESTEVKLKE